MNKLTPEDISQIEQIFDSSLVKHTCRFPSVTPQQMDMLGEIANTAIEVRDDAKKAAKRIFKWTLFLIAFTAVVGSAIAFVGTLWIKFKCLVSGP